MKELDPEKLLIYFLSLLLLILLTPLLHKLPRTKGRHLSFHLAYLLAVRLTLHFLPESIQTELFSPGGVVLLGTVLPIYHSIVAICTIDNSDDTSWLQFWITSGSLAYATEFIDDIRNNFPESGEHWYEFEFFFVLWLLLPMTDGAAVMCEFVTKPLMGRVAGRVKGKLEGWIQWGLVGVNAGHLWYVVNML